MQNFLTYLTVAIIMVILTIDTVDTEQLTTWFEIEKGIQ